MRVTRSAVVVCLGAALSAGAATPKKSAGPMPAPPILPFTAVERMLPNGLKVIIVPTGFPNLVSLQIPVQTGSRNEIEPGKSGFAHFFEHMMFRGTKAYPPPQYQAILTRAGARQNAYTTDDYTNYHTTFAKEDLETILKIEADRFQNLDYAEADFKTESRAVLGEYNKNSADPLRKWLEVQREHAYATHTYKHTTMGFLKDIEDMPNQYAYSRAFFDRWYRPEYTTIIVAGDVVPTEALRLIEKYWGGWKRGSYAATIPQEPEPNGPISAHVPWPTPTLPWVTVAFHGPAFSESEPGFAALDLLLDLTFGETSELYQKLVVQEQKVDRLFPYAPASADPSLVTIAARLKALDDAVYVRDAILRACARARHEALPERRVQDAKQNARYALLRRLDNTEEIAATLARFVRFRRSYETLNNLYRQYERLTSADLLRAAERTFTDERLVLTTLASAPMPEGFASVPRLAAYDPPAGGPGDTRYLTVKSQLTQIDFKLMFSVGSAHDPVGKEGLAALAAALIADAGSDERSIDDIRKALFPMAGRFSAQVDKELTTFSGSIHRENWERFLEIVLPMLTSPGLRSDDFARLKDEQRNALREDLRANNEEELGKEWLQARLFAGTPYGHPAIGTLAGIEAISPEDVRDFIRKAYTRAALTVGLTGEYPEAFRAQIERGLGRLSPGPALPAPEGVVARGPRGIEVEIIEKDTRATAISLGHPLAVTRSHPDFAALSVARAWLGEHRSSMSHLYERIRELRGMNYGDYAYIEAFPRGMSRSFPDPNTVRRAQLFEIWIRPVQPQSGPMALRIALFELRRLIERGLTEQQFESTRNYLMKNVYLMTATQEQRLGYALDSQWYGIGEFTETMRTRLAALTLAEVNRAIREHLSARNLQVVFIAKDAEGLKRDLVADTMAAMKYESPKPQALLDEDRVIAGMKLGIAPDAVRIVPVEEVLAR
jgi:zinc protease